MRVEVGAQQGQIGLAVATIADGVDAQLDPVEAEGGVPAQLEGDQLRIHGRVVRADRLGIDLGELSVAPALYGGVAVAGAGAPEPHGLGLARQAVSEVEPHQRGGELRAQGQHALALVLEQVHLLAHDLGALAGGAGEQRLLLEHRRGGLAIARALTEGAEALDHRVTGGLARWQPVERAAGSVELVAHPRSPDRKGLAASS